MPDDDIRMTPIQPTDAWVSDVVDGSNSSLLAPLLDKLAAVKTSDLLAMLNPDVATDIIHEVGGTCDPAIFIKELAAEIDRRIPPRDPRVGKLCRLSTRVSFPHPGRVGRIVSVEPGGTLHFREETWTQEYVDIRVPAAEIVEWLEEPLSSDTHGDATEK